MAHEIIWSSPAQIIYRVGPEKITILRVVHGSRLLKNVPGSFEESAQEEFAIP
jgi:plasmid stabilization system protein ParE